MKDYYKVLGVQEHVTEQEIKKAYRKLAKEWHPDVNKSPDAHNRFIEISEAYELLINSESRQEYDRIRRGMYNENHRQYDFSKAQQTARERGEYYSSISLDELFGKILKTAVEIGKATLIGEEEYNKSITLKDWLKLGLKGWLALLMLILTFTGVLAPVTIPILLKLVLIDKRKVVGIVNILIAMLLYVPILILIVLRIGYSLNLFYFSQDELRTYMVLLLTLTASIFIAIHRRSSKNRGEINQKAMIFNSYNNISRRKITGTAVLFTLVYAAVIFLTRNIRSIYITGLDAAVLFAAGAALGPLPGFIVGLVGNIITGINYGIHNINYMYILLFPIVGVWGGLITTDKSYNFFMAKINKQHIKKLLIYAFICVIFTTTMDIVIVSFKYGFYVIGDVLHNLLNHQGIRFLTIVLVDIPLLMLAARLRQ